jgi:hypothetical protein
MKQAALASSTDQGGGKRRRHPTYTPDLTERHCAVADVPQRRSNPTMNGPPVSGPKLTSVDPAAQNRAPYQAGSVASTAAAAAAKQQAETKGA